MDDIKNDPEVKKLLQDYHRAFAEEFTVESNDDGTIPESELERLRGEAAKLMALAVPKAVQRIVVLMESADKDATQLTAAKYIVDTVLSGKGLIANDDPLGALFADLKQKQKVATDRENDV